MLDDHKQERKEALNNLPKSPSVNLTINSTVDGSSKASAKAENIAAIIQQRGRTHGDAFKNLEDTAARWTSRLRAKFGYMGSALTLVDVCEFIEEMKLSRSAFGKTEEIDHQNDIGGYAIIAAAWIEWKKDLAAQYPPLTFNTFRVSDETERLVPRNTKSEEFK